MSPKTELELQWTILYTLFFTVWVATGFCVYSLAACPCVEHAFWVVVMLTLAGWLSAFVWPRRVSWAK